MIEGKLLFVALFRGHIPAADAAGVVDQGMEGAAAELGQIVLDGLRQAEDLAALHQVGGVEAEVGLGMNGLDVGLGVGAGVRPPAHADDAISLAGKKPGGRQADAGGGAGDDDGFHKSLL